MAITLTEKAAKHINRYIERRGKGVGLRFGVRTTGCSGLAYKLEYVDEVADEDSVFESHGVKVFVDPKSLPYICLLYTSPSPRDGLLSRMPSSA